MSKPLTQIEPGTACTIKETGQSGTLEKIFYYPTKYEVKTDNGHTNHYTKNMIYDVLVIFGEYSSIYMYD